MKKKITIYDRGKKITRTVSIIPFRYTIAVLISILEILSIIGIVVLLTIYIPYFYILIYATVILLVIGIIGSHDNPDYKIPWILVVILLPIIGMMLYFIFNERKLPKRFLKKYHQHFNSLIYDDSKNHQELEETDKLISTYAKGLCKISGTHLYKNTKLEYYKIGEEMHQSILKELEKARKFIFLEFFIIEEGVFWNSILEILKAKVQEGVEVKVVYDDIGCMNTLKGNYYKQLREFGIDCVLFSKLKAAADGEFNNRSHRKILVIDGLVAFTGGVNIADEYINEVTRFGHWKDTGIKLEGEAVKELTKLFITDYYINVKKDVELDYSKYYVQNIKNANSYVIPFGDGPNPIYVENVGKNVIINILNQAKEYAYITTPYLITDNEVLKTIQNTALRGIDVRIITPHIPDKKIVFELTRSNYDVLIQSGVKIYEYEPGFIHAKSYVSDDTLGMIGTINLDYRSLTHHFENGVWIYNDEVLIDMKNDFLETLSKSILIEHKMLKVSPIRKLFRSILKLFSPMF